MKWINAVFTIPALFIAVCFLLCSHEPAGPGTDDTDKYKGLYGKLVDNDGSPVAGAVIKAIGIGETLLKSSAVTSVFSPDTDSVSTDDSGYYSFVSLDAGTYNLQSNYDNGSLVALIKGIEYDSTGKVQQVATDTLREPGSIMGIVNTGTNDDGGVVCYVPGTSYLAMTDDSGVFILSDIPEGEYTITYRKEELKTVSDSGIKVHSGKKTQLVVRYLEADPGIPPPVPGGLTAVYDTVHGCVVLTWDPVKVEDIAGYHIYRNDTSSTDPERISDNIVTDTIFTDTVFTDTMNESDRVLAYRIKAQDEDANLSTLYSKAVVVDAPSPTMVRTFISFHMLNTQGDDTASINDTVTIIASYRNEMRENVLLQWFEGDDDSPLQETDISGFSGSDTLLISWSNPSVKTIRVAITDEKSDVWIGTVDVHIYNFIPVVIGIRGDTTISINDSIPFFASAEDRDGTIKAYAWDFDGDGTYDFTDNNGSTWHRYENTGTFEAKLKVTDDDSEEEHQQATITVVQDVPVADAGDTFSISPGDTAHLHGTALQDFGEIVKWEWKIGDGEWSVGNKPDTWFIMPEKAKSVICSLGVTDDDDNYAADAVKVYNTHSITGMSTGRHHSMILETDGTLWACGDNGYGQLGDGTVTNRLTPVMIMRDVLNMSASFRYSLIIKTDNTLWACGSNTYGQLGDGTKDDHLTPAFIMDDVHDVATGFYHSLIIKTDGTLWTCGLNTSGQLGDGTFNDHLTPVFIMDNVLDVEAGATHSLILKTDNTLWGMGNNSPGKLGDGGTTHRSTPVFIMDDVRHIGTGADHSMILKNDNTLWVCGYNKFGQLGDGTRTDRSTPVLIMNDVQSVSGGASSSLILTTGNILFGCGSNSLWVLGLERTDDYMTPTKIMENVQYMSTGGSHSLMIKTDGSLWGCGSSSCGIPGNGSAKTPVRITLPEE